MKEGIIALATLVVLVAHPFAPCQAQYLVVGNSDSDAISRYDGNTGEYIDVFVPSGAGGLDLPRGLTFGPDRHLYVTSYYAHAILKYDGNTGAFIGAFVPSRSGGLYRPTDLTFGPDGNLYVSGEGGHILKYHGQYGWFLADFIPYSYGLPGAPGCAPSDLGFGPDSNLYISTSNCPKILKYNGQTGEYLEDFVYILGPSHFQFGPDGHLYAYSNSEGIQRFDGQSGELIDNFIDEVIADDFTFGPDGNLYLIKGNVMGVARYDGLTGAYIDDFVPDGIGGLTTASGLAFSPIPPPVTGFHATVRSGYSPLQVQFVNDSTGNITSHQWDFGDSSASTEASPAHIYTLAGTYTVSLTVSGPGGTDTETKSQYISVAEPNVELPTVTVRAVQPFAAELRRKIGKFVVYRTGQIDLPLTVNYSIKGTARSSSDYKRLPGTLLILKGKRTATIWLQPIDDKISEQPETVIVKLKMANDYKLGSPATAKVVISDND